MEHHTISQGPQGKIQKNYSCSKYTCVHIVTSWLESKENCKLSHTYFFNYYSNMVNVIYSMKISEIRMHFKITSVSTGFVSDVPTHKHLMFDVIGSEK
jgi:hypothetical protein